jgi:ABC-type transporter Mla maintaining outer membrane lipid asymmetry ATPase subunit MlaF
MLFQNNALFDSLTVEENVEFPLKMFSSMSKEERKHRVNECLSKVNLVNSNNKFPSEISGGMKKRVGIARAIALPIKYLFCDEPNSGLDPQTSIVIDNLIQEMQCHFFIDTRKTIKFTSAFFLIESNNVKQHFARTILGTDYVINHCAYSLLFHCYGIIVY